MAVTNKLTKTTTGKEMTFEVEGSEIKLTPEIVKHYFVSGNVDLVSNQEIMMFMSLCKFRKLNPWVHDAYCVKYSQNQPATIVESVASKKKRADAQEDFDGYVAGIIVQTDEGYTYRQGAFYNKQEETLVGGWAEVFRKNKSKPFRVEVSLEEYIGRTKDGKVNGQWTSKPATMIRKVALGQALTEAYPKALGDTETTEEQATEFMPNEEVIEAQAQTYTREESPVQNPIPQPVQRTQPTDDFQPSETLF